MKTTDEETRLIDDYVARLKKKEKQRNKAFKKNIMYKRKGPVFFSILISAVVIISVVALFLFNVIDFDKISGAFKGGSSEENIISAEPSEEISFEKLSPKRPTKIAGTTLIPETDFNIAEGTEKQTELIKALSSKSITTAFLSLNFENELITDSDGGVAYLTSFIKAAAEENISVFALADISTLEETDFNSAASLEKTAQKIETLAGIENLGGLVLSGIEEKASGEDFKNYVLKGNITDYQSYTQNKLTSFVKNLSETVKTKAPTLYFAVICDPVYQSKNSSETGMNAQNRDELLKDKNADILLWLEKGYFDGAFVRADASTEDKNPSFKEVVDWWSENIPSECDIGFILSSDLAAKGEGSWKNPDQLTRQLMTLNTLNRFTFCFNSYNAMENDKTEASSVAYKYLNGGVSDEYVLTDLTITSPQKTNITVYENFISFVGASDPNFSLTLNGESVERSEYGHFSFTKSLKLGKNTFTFNHKGESKTYTVYYDYVVIQSYSPSAALVMESDSTIVVRAIARVGSTVTASLNGKTVTLESMQDQKDTAFATYVGALEVGSYNVDTSLGGIVFKGTHNGITDTYKSGNVTVTKKPEPLPESITSQIPIIINPDASFNHLANPISAGNNLIAEVAKYQIETFDGNTVDDLSQPYNSYLPKGTLDYCSEKTIYDPSSGCTYRTLNYGKRVYTTNKGVANITTKRGTLPSYNMLNASSISTEGRHTVLTLACYWKAPFTVTLAPQKYYGGPSNDRGIISSPTYTYLDIKFSYATVFEGDVSALGNSPVFSKAELIKGTSDYTLRLHLRKAGKFYGWTADYDNNGNLVFKFLNPAKATKANNSYGATLNGIVIALDAGHGGSDGGASGSNPNYDEAERNLFLAKQIETKLKALGATVVMTRTSDVKIDNDTRILAVKNAQPDLAVSIHRNAARNSSAKGFDSFYFNPYTELPARKIKNRMAQAGTYSSADLGWHYFFLSRISDCPVVLTENGFMTNPTDYNNMLNSAWNDRCADAIVKGIVDYFLEIS